MRSFLKPIFMVEIGTRTILTVTDSIVHWRKYVDEALLFVKKGCVKHWLVCLSSFHKNYLFTYELQGETNCYKPKLILLFI